MSKISIQDSLILASCWLLMFKQQHATDDNVPRNEEASSLPYDKQCIILSFSFFSFWLNNNAKTCDQWTK